MFKSVLVSMITSVLVIVFALVGVDVLVNNEKENGNEIKRISYDAGEENVVKYNVLCNDTLYKQID